MVPVCRASWSVIEVKMRQAGHMSPQLVVRGWSSPSSTSCGIFSWGKRERGGAVRPIEYMNRVVTRCTTCQAMAVMTGAGSGSGISWVGPLTGEVLVDVQAPGTGCQKTLRR